jgi:hypothetical protein
LGVGCTLACAGKDGTQGPLGSQGANAAGANGAISTVPGCKRGIAWSGHNLTLASLSQGISWWYNWGSTADAHPTGVVFEPMVWGQGFDVARTVAGIAPGAQHLLGFNEPNFFAQSNLSAAQAAALWPQLEDIARQKALNLVSPAVNFCGDDTAKTGPCHDTNPVHYLQDFLAQCAGCKVDHIAVHWYNCDGDSLRWYLGQFKQFGKPIWLTEFACAYGGDTSAAGQERYMREAVPILEQDADVYRYAWFSGPSIASAQLLDAAGALTSLGQVYLGLAHNENCNP